MKLMALASPAFFGSVPMLAEPVANSSRQNSANSRRIGRPRLFYNTTALKHIQQMLSSDPATDAFLKNHGEELLRADLVPESVAEIGGGQQSNYYSLDGLIQKMLPHAQEALNLRKKQKSEKETLLRKKKAAGATRLHIVSPGGHQ